jgi:DHA2 family multidrug resistance protein
MGTATVVWSGLTQGLGTGFVFVPLASVAFATLAPALRNEGAALFSLMRNLGSSIGISAVETLLTRNTQIVHAGLAAHVTPFGAMARAQPPVGATLHSLEIMNAMVTQQAAMIAYNDDFQLMMVMSIVALPLIFLLRKARKNTNAAETVAVE